LRIEQSGGPLRQSLNRVVDADGAGVGCEIANWFPCWPDSCRAKAQTGISIRTDVSSGDVTGWTVTRNCNTDRGMGHTIVIEAMSD
jgi:hypothetical protein